MHEDVALHGLASVTARLLDTDMCVALAEPLIEVGHRSYLPIKMNCQPGEWQSLKLPRVGGNSGKLEYIHYAVLSFPDRENFHRCYLIQKLASLRFCSIDTL